MMDLMYFGYTWDDDSRQNQCDFIKEIKEKFPNVQLKDAYDGIKGYRYEVWLEDSQEDDYMSFLIGGGWTYLSLSLQIDMTSKEKQNKVKRWIDLAKQQYPQNFKKNEDDQRERETESGYN